MNKIRFKKIKSKLNKNFLKQLIKIIKAENASSILARLNYENISLYLRCVIESKELDLFLVMNKKIIGYAIVAEQPKFLTSSFKNFQFKILFDLLLKFRVSTIFNLFLFKIGIENYLISIDNRVKISKSVNLNLLAINEKYQSKGVGKKFMTYILKTLKIKKRKYITCETDNYRSKKFYIKKLKFKELGKKIRYPIFTSVLIKKI